MDSYDEVYKIIKSFNKIDESNYNYLVNLYGKKIVNTVIENLVYEESNMNKYDYYISHLSSMDEDICCGSFQSYMRDLGCINKLSLEENKKLLEEINGIIKKIDSILFLIKREEDIVVEKKYWLLDRINDVRKKCNNNDKMEIIKLLYNDFINKRNIIVEGNLRLVIFMAQRCHEFDKYYLDYIQNGNMGLMNAIEKYDSSFNVTFSTYACFWIKHYICRNMSSVLYNYKIPFNKVIENNKVNRVINLLEQKLCCDPSDMQIAKCLNVSEKKVREIRELFYGTLSLEAEITNELLDENEDIALKDCINDYTDDFSNEIMAKCMEEDLSKIMREVLTEKEMYILIRRFGLVGKSEMSLREIGKEMGLGKDTVRKYEMRARKKIKTVGEHLQVYLK